MIGGQLAIRIVRYSHTTPRQEAKQRHMQPVRDHHAVGREGADGFTDQMFAINAPERMDFVTWQQVAMAPVQPV